VVLSKFLIADPRVVRELRTARVPHLPVRVRDGTGLIPTGGGQSPLMVGTAGLRTSLPGKR